MITTLREIDCPRLAARLLRARISLWASEVTRSSSLGLVPAVLFVRGLPPVNVVIRLMAQMPTCEVDVLTGQRVSAGIPSLTGKLIGGVGQPPDRQRPQPHTAQTTGCDTHLLLSRHSCERREYRMESRHAPLVNT